MTKVFVDTHYWIAVLDIRDPWHEAALEARRNISDSTLVTSDEVLIELLNAFSGRGSLFRRLASSFVYRLRREPGLLITEQSRESFDAGLILYDGRQDKRYSLVDCISMTTMRRLGVESVLTHDHHFAQEGFNILIS